MVELVPSSCPDADRLESLARDTLELPERSEVEAHLQGCATCRERLAILMGDSPTNQIDSGRIISLSRRPEPVDLPQPGEVIAGKYRVDAEIGRGGMGVVLGARHIELGHLVAIKVLHSNNALALPRFLREARTSVRLCGEHVVRVFDYGKLSQGSPFLVMEHLQGEDLAKVIARGLVPIDTAIRYMIDVCEALEEAHALDVVHRDLKPANVFVVYDAKGETRIKVLDFGISKWLDPDAGVTELTASDAVMGSPLYMSPEQVRASRDVDLRTDIWAVGVILYELVAGVTPFAALSAPAVAVNIASSAPKPLSAARVGVTTELEAVVRRCLEKEPSARFQSVAELAGALRGLLVAEPAPRSTRLARWVVAAGVLLLALSVGWLWALASARAPASEQKAQAITSAPPPPAAAEVQPVPPAAGSGGDNQTVDVQKPKHIPSRRSLDIGEVLPP